MAVGTSLNSGVAALSSFQRGIEVIGANVANVNTVGYKGAKTYYAENFSQMLKPSSQGGANQSNSSAMQIGTGVKLQSVGTDFGQGTLTLSGSKTDLGIAGNGFFRVRDPLSNSDFVTRAGNFRLDNNGYLITQDGMRVQGLNDGSVSYTATSVGGALTYTKTTTAPSTVGDLKIDFGLGTVANSTGGAFTDAQVQASAPKMNSFGIDQFGNINIVLTNGESFVRGKLLLQNFKDPNSLVREGNNLFGQMESAGPEGGIGLSEANNSAGGNGLGVIQAQSLELSNVDLGAEFANLISTQRAFQAGSRIVTVTDTVLEEIVNLKR